jgi:hypothetical protein
MYRIKSISVSVALALGLALALCVNSPLLSQGKLKIHSELNNSSKSVLPDSSKAHIPESYTIEGKGKGSGEPKKTEPVKPSSASRRGDKLDSLIGEIGNVRALASGQSDWSDVPRKIYSSKKVKAILDSLGVGRLDTLAALASLRPEMSEADLMSKINSSFLPGASQEELQRSLNGISTATIRNEALNQLPAVGGVKLDARYLQKIREMGVRKKLDSLIAAQRRALRELDALDQVRQKYLDSLGKDKSKIDQAIEVYKNNAGTGKELMKQKVLDSLTLRQNKISAQLKSPVGSPADPLKQKVLDSLTVLRSKYKDTMDSLNTLKDKGELLRAKYENVIVNANEAMVKSQAKVDCVRKVVNKRPGNFKIKEREIQPELKIVELVQKPKFLDPFYFEGVASAFKRAGNMDEIQLSPGIGYEFGRNFSIGASPNFIIRLDNRRTDLSAGYRSFLKYTIFAQRAYLQAEDWVSPKDQNVQRSHRILGGAGVLIPVTKKMSFNTSLLYRVGDTGPDATQDSRWVFRIGISSIGERKFKRK